MNRVLGNRGWVGIQLLCPPDRRKLPQDLEETAAEPAGNGPHKRNIPNTFSSSKVRALSNAKMLATPSPVSAPAAHLAPVPIGARPPVSPFARLLAKFV